MVLEVFRLVSRSYSGSLRFLRGSSGVSLGFSGASHL